MLMVDQPSGGGHCKRVGSTGKTLKDRETSEASVLFSELGEESESLRKRVSERDRDAKNRMREREKV